MDESTFHKAEATLSESHPATLANKISYYYYAPTQVERFHDYIIRQNGVIDNLKHKCRNSERLPVGFVKEVCGLAWESINRNNHPKLREGMQILSE